MIPGQVIWVALDPSAGRDQGGRRPALVISSLDHLHVVDSLLIVVPCTTTNRSWPNHIRLTGPIELTESTFAMTEQPRTLARSRVVGDAGFVDEQCLTQVVTWVQRWVVRPSSGG